jgi:hypothetical protein
MMENHGPAEIIGNTADAPFMNLIASQYGVATNFFGVTHPSLPNYLAAISGDFQGIWDDCRAGADSTCPPEEFVPNSGDSTSSLLLTPAQVASASARPHLFQGQNLVDQIEASGRTWKAYMQSLPSPGSAAEYSPGTARIAGDGGATTVKIYAQKHDPFMYFADIRNDAARMAKIVPFEGQFAADLASGTLPDFVWISPDQCHDMHGIAPEAAALAGLPRCGTPASGLDHGAIQLADAFLKDTVTAIMQSSAWREDSVLVIAWDEDDYAGHEGCCGSPTTTGGAVLGGGKAPLLVVTSKGPRHVVSTAPSNHYTLLAMIQKLWGLPCLGHACELGESQLLTPLFRP